MTVQANYEEKTYVCNGVTTEFPIPWKFFDEEVRVYNNTEERYYPQEAYELISTGNTGTLKMKVAPEDGTKITIVRSVALYQMVKFFEGEDFPAHDYEYSLDRIYMVLQAFSKEIDRCAKSPIGGEDWDSFIRKFIKMGKNGRFGIGYYDETITYNTNDIAQTDDGNWWISVRDGNKGNTPKVGGGFWIKLSVTKVKASDVSVSPSDFEVITGQNVQTAMKQVDSKIALSENYDSVLLSLDLLNDAIGGSTEVPLQSLQTHLHDGRPSHKSAGALVYDEYGVLGVIDTITDQTATVSTLISRGTVAKPSQVIDTSTTDFPSNNAVKMYVDGLIGNINTILDEINGEII